MRENTKRRLRNNIREHAGSAYHEVFCLQFCYVHGEGAGVSADREQNKGWMKILPAYCNEWSSMHAQFQQGGGSYKTGAWNKSTRGI